MSCKIRFWDRIRYKARTHLLLRKGQASKSVWLELATRSLTNDNLFFLAESREGSAMRDSSRISSSEDPLLSMSSSVSSPAIKDGSHSENIILICYGPALLNINTTDVNFSPSRTLSWRAVISEVTKGEDNVKSGESSNIVLPLGDLNIQRDKQNTLSKFHTKTKQLTSILSEL